MNLLWSVVGAAAALLDFWIEAYSMHGWYDHDIDDFSITLLPRGLHKPKSGTDNERWYVRRRQTMKGAEHEYNYLVVDTPRHG